MRAMFAIPLSLLLACAGACEVVGSDDPALDELEGSPLTTEVARAVIGGGVENEDVWRFLEAEPGELVLHAILSEASAQQYPWLKLEMDVSYVELYQRLTGKPAPRTLVEAQARADARRDEESESQDTSGLVDETGGWSAPAGRSTLAISAADFQDDYCPLGADYTYCWPSFYGSPYVQRKTWSMYGYVAAVNDTIDFRMRYKPHSWSSWSTLVSAQALPGQVHYVDTSYWGYRRWRRWEVLDNGDNLVRYSVRGSD